MLGSPPSTAPSPSPIPTCTRRCSQVQLLSRGWPLLLTCFGLHEARLEASLLEALEAHFTRHAEGSFGRAHRGWNGGNARNHQLNEESLGP